jgi:hypothetical protein
VKNAELAIKDDRVTILRPVKRAFQAPDQWNSQRLCDNGCMGRGGTLLQCYALELVPIKLQKFGRADIASDDDCIVRQFERRTAPSR